MLEGKGMGEGYVGRVDWDNTDILVTTPHMFYNQLELSQSSIRLKPQIVAVDEADLLLELDKNISKKTTKIIQQVKKENKNTQFILTASSFPHKYQRKPAIEKLTEVFWPLSVVEGFHKHQFPPGLELLYVELTQT